jgi:hypothetical protein
MAESWINISQFQKQSFPVKYAIYLSEWSTQFSEFRGLSSILNFQCFRKIFDHLNDFKWEEINFCFGYYKKHT